MVRTHLHAKIDWFRQRWYPLRWFYGSMFTSSAGRSGYAFACAWFLVVSDEGNPAVAVFFAIISVTELLTSPIAGWITDRFDRRRVFVIAELFRFAAVIVLATALAFYDIRWMIWISAIPFAVCDRVALTASQAMIPSVNKHFSPGTANSLCFFFMQAGGLVAAIAIGLLLHTSTICITFHVIAIAFILSAASMCLIVRDRAGFSSCRGHCGTRFVLKLDTQLLRLIALYALLYGGGVLVSILGPGYVLNELRGNSVDFGELESAWSAGSILGAILLIPLARMARAPALQTVIFMLTALTFGALKFMTLPWVLAVFALAGTLYNLGRVAIEGTLQDVVPGETLGRAKSVLHCAGVSIGLILFGLVSSLDDGVEPSTMFLAFAALLLAAATALAAFGRR